jgi:hypothetical protein
MNEDIQITGQQKPATLVTSTPSPGKQDLVVLTFMTQRVRVTLHALEPTMPESLPLLYTLTERRQRTHRLVIYHTQALLQKQDIAFVGFVSRRRSRVDPFIASELERIDTQMLTELVTLPGLFTYSSLELRPGTWYNLVLFKDATTKDHLKAITAHQYAAYKIAPHYYDWIRLHNGTLPGGLPQGTLHLHTTKHYSFPDTGWRSTIHSSYPNDDIQI